MQAIRLGPNLSSGGIVDYAWSGDLVWLASVGGASLFTSTFFHSLVGSSVVDACIKAVVQGGGGAAPTWSLR
ncbi:hypothetical protein BHM03_00053579 [Ensete ventricosum]|nr:hypothetical protein BHM03_00053579 [Ensete ventricosum]